MDYERLFRRIDESQEEMIRWFLDYLRFKSLTKKELEVQRWLRKEFEKLGIFDKVDYFEVAKNRPNVIGAISGQDRSSRGLIFNGHSDVAPADSDQDWRVRAWKPIVKDGRVYGRGASDMKGGNTAMIWAAKAVVETGFKIRGDLMVECVVGEEQMEHALGTTAVIERGYKAPFAIVTEPTNCEIHPVSNGCFDFRLTVKGKEIHDGMRNLLLYPQRFGIPFGAEVGVDTIEKMELFVSALRRLERQWGFRWRSDLPISADEKQGLGSSTICINTIRGGTNPYAIAGECEIAGEVYYPYSVDGKKVIKEIEDVVKKTAHMDDWLRFNPPKLEAPLNLLWPPSRVSHNHPGCRKLAKAWGKATGQEAVFSCFKATTDAAFLCAKGIPAVIMGPGDMSMGTHGPDEYVPIEQLIKCTKAYAAMIIDWCGIV